MAMMTPEQLAKNDSEDGHQTALFAWAAIEIASGSPYAAELALMFAIPNGGSRGDSKRSRMIRGAQLKAQGVKKGVPDFFLPVRRGSWAGLFIELTRPKSERGREGVASAEQNVWIPKLQAQGFGACTVVGWEAARDIILSYLAS